jgi:ferredoxin-type protein NapF
MVQSSAIDRRSFFAAPRRPSPERHDPAASSNGPLRALISQACLAYAGVVCMSCRDACREQAIRFLPRRGSAFLPEVIAAACTGCGACLSPCPAGALSLAAQPEDPADA